MKRDNVAQLCGCGVIVNSFELNVCLCVQVYVLFISFGCSSVSVSVLSGLELVYGASRLPSSSQSESLVPKKILMIFSFAGYRCPPQHSISRFRRRGSKVLMRR